MKIILTILTLSVLVVACSSQTKPAQTPNGLTRPQCAGDYDCDWPQMCHKGSCI
jgi:hypothetical protein